MTKRLTIALVALALFVLVAVMPVSAAYYTVAPFVNQSATVFIGEQGLNISCALNAANGTANSYAAPTLTTIGWWASAAQIWSTSPTKSIDLNGRYTNFMVASSDFVGYTGNWYLLAANGTTPASASALVFSVADPSLDIKVWDFNQATDVTGKSVPQGEYLGFRVDTNMYPAIDARYRGAVTNTPATDGYLDIKVKSETGTTYTSLYDASRTANTIVRLNVSNQPWTWGTAPGFSANWSTDVLDTSGQYAYPAGTYTVSVESKLNAMKDNYKNAGADYTGKTVSQSYTVTLVSDTVKIEANKDSVVRSKPFSITITGKPSTTYKVWVKGTSTMDGSYDNQPPMINQNQDGVKMDNFAAAPYVVDLVAGAYVFQNSGGNNIWQDVAHGTYSATITSDYRHLLGNGTYVYANVTTSSSGTRTVEFITTNWTKAQKYTIRVELNASGQYKSDEVDVKVEKGAVTIVAAGDQSYYLGEEIKFSGTNTESYKTYLFIIGPNLATDGAQLGAPRTAVTSGTASTFVQADVQSDNTWSYKWGTSSLPLDAGTYTIYAVSQPVNKASGNLDKVAYGTVSIIVKKPFVSATASQSTVAKGDKVFITGTAEGQPSAGVQIWILGKNKDIKAGEAVNSDSSFSYEVTQQTTKDLYAGQYFVVVQHPMQNNVFDIDTITDGDDKYVVNYQLVSSTAGSTYTRIFKLEGTGSLQGSDAAEALVQGINDPNVDDTYTKLQFLIEEPTITIDPIGDKHVGDKFTITATTNLAVDDEILVQVYSSSFNPTQKSQSGEFSGATGTVKVTKGDSGMNIISFDVDSSTFKPDEYLVSEAAVIQDATGTALFNVLESVPQTATPVVTATGATPVVTVTSVQTTEATPTPTPTKSPGYGALIALIGLGAVAFVVVRRH